MEHGVLTQLTFLIPKFQTITEKDTFSSRTIVYRTILGVNHKKNGKTLTVNFLNILTKS